MKNEEQSSLLELLTQMRLKNLEVCLDELREIKRILTHYLQDLIKEEAFFTSVEATRAWEQVMHKISTVGSYDAIVFDDPLIHAVIEKMGGWVYLCGLSQQSLALKASVFKMHYVKCQWCPPTDYPKVLKGRLP